MKTFNRIIARFLIVSVAYLGMPLPAHAGVIPTDKVAAANQATQQTSRERIEALLSRADVRAGLEKNGVDPDEAKARVAALTDEEVDDLAGKIEKLPAGGDGGFSALISAGLIVFIVLLITDILGLTKVFSFTRPAK